MKRPISDLNTLVKEEVLREISLYKTEDLIEHEKTRDAISALEELVIKTNGGVIGKVHNIIQDIAIAIIAYFTFR